MLGSPLWLKNVQKNPKQRLRTIGDAVPYKGNTGRVATHKTSLGKAVPPLFATKKHHRLGDALVLCWVAT